MSEVDHNNRKHLRRRTFKEGLVSFNHDELTVPCTVRDKSESGAKLQFEGPVSLPESFFLTIPLDGAKWPAAVEWSKGMTCGVRFTGPAEASSIHNNQFIKPYRPAADVAPPVVAAAAPEPVKHRTAQKKSFGRRT